MDEVMTNSSALMGRIIYCSDLILRIDDPEEDITNVTEWIKASTEFQPINPDGCVIRQEVRSSYA